MARKKKSKAPKIEAWRVERLALIKQLVERRRSRNADLDLARGLVENLQKAGKID